MQYIVDHINKTVCSTWIPPTYEVPKVNVNINAVMVPLKVPLVPLKPTLQPIPSTFHELLQWGDKAREQDKQRLAAHPPSATQDVFHPARVVFLAQI
jgi:hypothetical protein